MCLMYVAGPWPASITLLGTKIGRNIEHEMSRTLLEPRNVLRVTLSSPLSAIIILKSTLSSQVACYDAFSENMSECIS